MAQFFHALPVDAGVGHLQCEAPDGELLQVSQSAFGLLLLGRRLDSQYVAQQDEGQDHADHTHGVGHGIAHGDVGCVNAGHAEIGLLCGAQSGCVGDGTREYAHKGGDGCAGGVGDDDGHRDACQDGDEREHVECQSALLERREEAGTHRQSDGVDEEHEAELVQEVQQRLVEIHAEIAEYHADEQDPGQSERYVAYFQFAEYQTQRNDQ